MIDVARHFYSLPTLKRQIDAMERVKLNVLRASPGFHAGERFEDATQARVLFLRPCAEDRRWSWQNRHRVGGSCTDVDSG
jgi:Glycosyl hydrolase family 20, catalytic domain